MQLCLHNHILCAHTPPLALAVARPRHNDTSTYTWVCNSRPANKNRENGTGLCHKAAPEEHGEQRGQSQAEGTPSGTGLLQKSNDGTWQSTDQHKPTSLWQQRGLWQDGENQSTTLQPQVISDAARITVGLTPGERLMEKRGPTGASTAVNQRARRTERAGRRCLNQVPNASTCAGPTALPAAQGHPGSSLANMFIPNLRREEQSVQSMGIWASRHWAPCHVAKGKGRGSPTKETGHATRRKLASHRLVPGKGETHTRLHTSDQCYQLLGGGDEDSSQILGHLHSIV